MSRYGKLKLIIDSIVKMLDSKVLGCPTRRCSNEKTNLPALHPGLVTDSAAFSMFAD